MAQLQTDLRLRPVSSDSPLWGRVLAGRGCDAGEKGSERGTSHRVSLGGSSEDEAHHLCRRPARRARTSARARGRGFEKEGSPQKASHPLSEQRGDLLEAGPRGDGGQGGDRPNQRPRVLHHQYAAHRLAAVVFELVGTRRRGDRLRGRQAQFFGLLKQIGDFLGIKQSEDAEEVEVFTCGDLSFLKALSEDDSFSKTEIRRIKKQILASESYCIPQKHTVYLANLSINHAAEEAAHYLKFLCSGAEQPRHSVDAFYANVIHEALGFFGSKIINHKRKCFHEKDYAGLIRYLSSGGAPKERKIEMQISLLILKHRLMDRRGSPIRSSRFYLGRHDLFFGVTHGLGYMLGDRLYYALVHGRISKEEIRELFCDPMKDEGEPYELYRKLLRRVRTVKIPKRA